MRHHSIKLIYLLTLTLATLYGQFALAHSDHGSPITADQAVDQAAYLVALMVQKEEKVEGESLEKIWIGAKDKKIFKKSFSYFVVSFHDAKLNRILYIMLDAYGDFKGANFSGTFKGVK